MCLSEIVVVGPPDGKPHSNQTSWVYNVQETVSHDDGLTSHRQTPLPREALAVATVSIGVYADPVTITVLN